MRDQKAEDLASNYDIVKSLGGPKIATQAMLRLSGKEKKQAWIRQFKQTTSGWISAIQTLLTPLRLTLG
jgi:hypothetical protein